MVQRNAWFKSLSNSRLALLFKDKGSFLKIAVLLFLGLTLLFFGAGSAAKRNDDTDSTELSDSEELERICSSVLGVGDCRVIIGYTPSSKLSERRVESVCVVCEGANSAKVQKRLTELLSSLYGVGTNRIYIAPMR